MRIDNVRVFGFEPAFRAMRNPCDSWPRADSLFYTKPVLGVDNRMMVPETPIIGPKDLELALKLIRAGGCERKFIRLIQVYADLTLPRYVWTELDTYKVATVRMSCSTMHTLGKRTLTQDDFEDELPEAILQEINQLIIAFQVADPGASKKRAKRKVKNALGEGFLQRATYMCSYETALNILAWRSGHQLDEWNIDTAGSLCTWLSQLPYMDQFAAAAARK
jgi:hypothetical protein